MKVVHLFVVFYQGDGLWVVKWMVDQARSRLGVISTSDTLNFVTPATEDTTPHLYDSRQVQRRIDGIMPARLVPTDRALDLSSDQIDQTYSARQRNETKIGHATELHASRWKGSISQTHSCSAGS